MRPSGHQRITANRIGSSTQASRMNSTTGRNKMAMAKVMRNSLPEVKNAA